MKRFTTLTWGLAVVSAAAFGTNANAGGKGSNGGGGRSSGFSGGSFSRGASSSMVRSGNFNSGNARVSSPIKTAPVKGLPTGGVTRPTTPVGPIVGNPTFPGGKNPFPGGGTVKPPIKPPVKDPIVGPIKPPVKPPIGPLPPKPPIVVDPVRPPVGPLCPPHDRHCHDGHGHCHDYWCRPPIVICLPGYVPPCETFVTEVVEVPVPVATPVAAPAAAPAAPAPAASQTAKAPEPAVVDELGKAVAQEAKVTEADKATQSKLPQVPVGATITLAGKDLGNNAGQVLVNVNQVVMSAEVVKWESAAATVSMPRIGLASATKAQLQLLLADGKLANSIEIELVPAEATAAAKTDAATTASTDTQPSASELAQK